MIDLKCCDFQAAVVKHDRLSHVRCSLRCSRQSEWMRCQRRSSRGEAMQCRAIVIVVFVGTVKPCDDVLNATGPEYD
jgi:hypothetical protein